METEVNINDFNINAQDGGIMMRQQGDLIWLNDDEAIQLRDFLNQLNLGDGK